MISIFLVSTGVICSICCLQVNGQCATPDCKGSSEEIDEILAITSVMWSLSAERNGYRMPSACTECPLGFDYLSEIHQCMKLVLQPLGWDSAREHCTNLALGAQLVAITNETKQDAVASYLENEFNKTESSACLRPTPGWLNYVKTVWISAQTQDHPNQCSNTSKYVWKPEPSVEIPFKYVKWMAGNPDCSNEKENCVQIVSNRDYHWNDFDCQVQLCSLCEL